MNQEEIIIVQVCIVKILCISQHERKISKIVIENKDRLIRFNKNILIKYFESHGVVVEWSQETLEQSYQNELVEDMLSLIASFSSKLYGKRSAENRKLNK